MILEKIYRSRKYQIGRLLAKIEEDGGSWLRRKELYNRVVEPHKKNRRVEKISQGGVYGLYSTPNIT
jgi:hypothetical protein